MDKYDVDTRKPIGRGAFGAVYLYQRRSDRKDIVIKQITMEDLTTDQRNGVKNEIDVFKRIESHPNIVRYLENFTSDNCFCIVMDYSPGGNLYDYLQKRLKENLHLKEKEIIHFFVQILRALHHIHQQNILHRDMKTQNILLDSTQEVVKICDFGISKHLTQTNAKTTVGTAHYMSPEVVEGKAYNKKSDVWSLGCIAYELINLKRAFDGETLSVILHNIVKCEYTPMPEVYSDELKQLTKDMLNVEPSLRPELSTMLASPVLINQLIDLDMDIGRLKPCNHTYKSSHKKKSVKPSINGAGGAAGKSHYEKVDQLRRQLRSVSLDKSSIVYFWTSRRKAPIILPVRGSEYVTQVCCGRTKKLGLTSKGRVLMWENKTSNLTSNSSSNIGGIARETTGTTGFGEWVPKVDGRYSGSNISQVCCGDHFTDFTVVRSARGTLMTCGSGEHGCLGHGATNESSKAEVVEDLVGSTVMQVSCGACHVMALTNDFQVYTWGKGSSGNLGFNDREDRLRPTQVAFSAEVKPKSLICGSNYSFVITQGGEVYACGDNRKNKLALLTEEQLESCVDDHLLPECLVFKKVTCKPMIDHKIAFIGTGPTHTAFLTETGIVFMAGSNKYGQLGIYNNNTSDSISLRPHLLQVPNQAKVIEVGCGDTYTVAVTEDNKVYCWGNDKAVGVGGGGQGNKEPVQIGFDSIESGNVKFHSLSVCHNGTMLAGQVVIHTGADGAMLES